MNALIQKYLGAINDHDVETAVSCFAEDAINHAAIPQAQGAQGMRSILTKLLKAIPDMHAKVEDVISDGDRVVCRVTVSGTHTGPLEFVRFPIPATGKSAKFEQIHIFRVKGDKIVEHWGARDDLGMLRQLGVLPFGEARAS